MSIMKRKKRLVLTALIACLGVFLSVGIYLVAPKFLAGDTQVTDLTLKSQVNEQTIQLTVTDQNQADTKVVVPLAEKLSYTPTKQTNAGVTYDQVNHQIVIDWLANHPKTVNLTVKAEQAGTYVFKAQTTRNDTPVNTAPTSVTITPVESMPTSSILSNSQTTLSEKAAVPGLQEQDTASSPSLDTKQASHQQKNSTKDLPDHADTDIVSTDDFDNQQWLLDNLKSQGLDVSAGKVTFEDLKKITDIKLTTYSDSEKKLPATIYYFRNLSNLVANSNNFVGEIPDEITQLPKLTNLELRNNNFNVLPGTFNNLDTDINVDISDNHSLVGLLSEHFLGIDGRDGTLDASGTQVVANNAIMGWLENIKKVMLSYTFISSRGYMPEKLTNFLEDPSLAQYGVAYFEILDGGEDQYLQVFSDVGSESKNKYSLGLGFRKGSYYGKELSPDHSFQIYNSENKLIYDGPRNPNAKIKIPRSKKSEEYFIAMDHTQDKSYFSGMKIKFTVVSPKIIQELKPEDLSIYYNDHVKYIKQTPFNMISTIQNNDIDTIRLDKTDLKVKQADKDKVIIDKTSVAIQEPNTKTWKKIPINDVSDITNGYQVKLNDLRLKPKENLKIRYTVTSREAFTNSEVLTSETSLTEGLDKLAVVSADMEITNGQLLFKLVPPTMSFTDSQIMSRRTEIKRKLPDWKMQIEDTRLNKTDWHITANLVSELKNSNGDSLGDSVIFKKTGQSNQVINTTNAVDVYDGKSSTADYQNVQWAADAGPTLSIAPGLAKLGSYTGTMQWTLVDAPV